MKQITDCILQAFLVMIQIVKIHGDRCKELTDIVTISLKKKKAEWAINTSQKLETLKMKITSIQNGFSKNESHQIYVSCINIYALINNCSRIVL